MFKLQLQCLYQAVCTAWQLKYLTMKGAFTLFVAVSLCAVPDISHSLNVLTDISPNVALHGHCHKNISTGDYLECLKHCVKDCSCLTFQTCGDDCQLCSSSLDLNPEAYRRNERCTSYHFSEPEASQHCDGGKYTKDMDCCLTSQPCLHGGTCQPVLPPTSTEKRFQCSCIKGSQGDRCETCSLGYQGKDCRPIKSCRGYVTSSRKPGNYTIIDDQNKPLKVFCDFDNTTAMTWTLVQSYELSEAKLFRENSFSEDLPINNRIPSWKKYRLSYDQMTSIQQDSTQWRVTCRYDRDGVKYTDYMRGLKNELHILYYVGDQCVNVEYINIRNESCTNCNVPLWQWGARILHFYSDEACASPCNAKPSFHPSPKICNTQPDYFGGYDRTNADHRCTSDAQATTQTWFGGY